VSPLLVFAVSFLLKARLEFQMVSTYGTLGVVNDFHRRQESTMPSSLNVTATVTALVPVMEVGALFDTLLGAVPPDVVPTSATINVAFPAPIAGSDAITASITAVMTEMDLGRLLTAVIAAFPADAQIQSGSLTFNVSPPVAA